MLLDPNDDARLRHYFVLWNDMYHNDTHKQGFVNISKYRYIRGTYSTQRNIIMPASGSVAFSARHFFFFGIHTMILKHRYNKKV